MTRHAPDLLSLTFGLVFSALGLLLAFGDVSRISLEWVAPLAAIALGVVVVLAARPTRSEAVESLDEPPL